MIITCMSIGMIFFLRIKKTAPKKIEWFSYNLYLKILGQLGAGFGPFNFYLKIEKPREAHGLAWGKSDEYIWIYFLCNHLKTL